VDFRRRASEQSGTTSKKEAVLRLPFRFRLDLATGNVALELEALPDNVSCAPPAEGTDYKTLEIPLDREGGPAKITTTADGLVTRIEVPGLWQEFLAEIAPAPKPAGKEAKRDEPFTGKPGKGK
jgi:hypothetical protein